MLIAAMGGAKGFKVLYLNCLCELCVTATAAVPTAGKWAKSTAKIQ